MSDYDRPLLRFVTDRDTTARLRASLETIRDRADDPDLRRRADDVLSGRGSMYDLARSSAFTDRANKLLTRAVSDLEAMTPEEREAAQRRALAHRDGPPSGDA